MATVDFGTGDGVTTAFNLPYAWQLGSTPVVYKTDWQGRQLQYTTSRTNISTESIPHNATWTDNGLTGLDNFDTAPDGTPAVVYVTKAATGTRLHTTGVALTAGTAYIRSIFIKPASTTDSLLCYIDGTIGAAGAFRAASALFNGVGGAPILAGLASDGGIEPLINAPGWYRMWVIFTPITSAVCASHIYPKTANATGWWGDQIEALQVGTTIPTSYIGTIGAVASATDYALSGTTSTFASAPASGAVLTTTYAPVPFLYNSRSHISLDYLGA